MVLRQAAGLGATGTALGLWLAGAVRPLIPHVVPDARFDPAATAALPVAVVLMAAWLPARRAARIEPTLALKRQ